MSVSSFSQTGSERHLSARGQVFSPSRQETGASEPSVSRTISPTE